MARLHVRGRSNPSGKTEEVDMVETLAGLLVAAAVSGIVPLVNAELLVVTAAAALPVALLPAVVLLSTLGQMVTKTWLFAVARWAPQRLPERGRAALERAGAALCDRGGAAGTVVFASAAVGLPPFYGVSLASGALGMPTASFVLSGSAGRLLRFGVLAWLGHRLGPAAMDALASLTALSAMAAV
jgi:membrane protein YqaA with SNARE-associated domain